MDQDQFATDVRASLDDTAAALSAVLEHVDLPAHLANEPVTVGLGYTVPLHYIKEAAPSR